MRGLAAQCRERTIGILKNIYAFILITCFTMGLAGLAPTAHGVDTEAIRDNNYNDLAQGELKSMALSSDGYLLPTYARREIGNSGAEVVWDALREKRGSILCATGHHGKLVRLKDGQTSQTLGSLPEPELTAMLRLKDDSVLIAAAPTGRIYRLASDDKLTTFAQVKAGFIWRMVQDREGAVWVATGTEGRLFRLHEKGKGPAQVEEIFKFKSANLLDLWIDEQGLLGEPGDIFVAGQNPGWLYRFRPSGKKVEVAYNASAEEIRALLPVEEGLALALNTERSPSSQALSMTLRMGGGAVAPMPSPAGKPSGPGGPPPGGPAPSLGITPEQSAGFAEAFSSAQQPQYGPPRSEVVVLNKAGFARRLWTSPERPIHDLALSPEKTILAAAGAQGRLFEIRPDGEFSVVADLREDYLVRIIPDDQGYLLATARNGVVVDMARTRAREAVYFSRPLDAGTLVKWGYGYWHGDLSGHQKALLAFRTGNDGDPESSLWGEWSKDYEAEVDRPLPLPVGPARYLQYRLTFKTDGAGESAPRMNALDAFYMEQNIAPRVMQITVTEMSAPSKPPSAAPGEGGGAPQPAAGAGGQPPRGEAQSFAGAREPRSNPMLFTIAWKAVDPNNDTLRYELYYKASDEKEWKLIDDKLMPSQLPLSVSGVADGRYRFKVIASDELSNPPGEGLRGELVSDEVVVDNTPPRFENKTVNVSGPKARLRLDVADDLSILSSVKVDIDNGDAYPLLPIDGILDQRRETFEVTTPDLKPGEHLATFNATDQRGNTSVEKIVFTIK
jgi:hypothetical protein